MRREVADGRVVLIAVAMLVLWAVGLLAGGVARWFLWSTFAAALLLLVAAVGEGAAHRLHLSRRRPSERRVERQAPDRRRW